MKVVRALAAALVAAVVLAGCGQGQGGSSPAPGFPTGSHAGHLALFGAESDRATSGVLVLDMATGELVRISDGREEAWSAAWAGPDRLAVVTGPPRISAQGKIAGELALNSADGSGEKIPVGDVADVLEVASSADGQQLAFLGRTEASSRACSDPAPPPLGLYLAAGDGSEVRRVADVPTTATSLALSPDGATVAMLDQGEDSTIPAGGDWCGTGQARLVLVDAATGAARVVVGMPQIIERPRFSPDGTTIVAAGGDFATNPARDVVFVDVATATARPLATPEVSESAPVFSPDGRQLAVLRPTTGMGDPGSFGSIAVGEADGSAMRTIARTGTEDQDLVWTPDGSALVVAGATITPTCSDQDAPAGGDAMGGCDTATATSDVRVVDADGGQLHQITATVSGEAGLAFAP